MCIDQLLFKQNTRSKKDYIMQNEVIQKASMIPNFEDSNALTIALVIYTCFSVNHPSLDTFSQWHQILGDRVSGRF